MKFQRPFRAEIVGEDTIWIVDRTRAFIACFPRLTDDVQKDFARASAIAAADLDDDVPADEGPLPDDSGDTQRR
ncbi:hypothetical protein ASG25_17450 [Rhizobium sp. Leaf384]|uniref:hypothetical protein n=1 Tax=unclassified Rhizobium TaxID=2613769 RepID=UPI000715CFFD|nr:MULTISPECIES: hypothetical protein [unclassified Rhizobium]KQR69379.1 hypothetical protein ASG03_09415 [Rhizobium sp. Leaf341]KQS77152.1 hypothetical protein ASG25_17450 [Rhizobium sp. Leaf384]KQS78424.1 hypothetical protein ASG58_08665 [Rhizobium sp. Leaf383]